MILDSNIIIYATQPEYQKVRDFLRSNNAKLSVSIITKLEVLGYHKLGVSEKSKLESFFHSVTILPITSPIIEIAIKLRQNKKYSIGDSIIAATALYHSKPLFTNNIDDFLSIDGLEVIDMKSVL